MHGASGLQLRKLKAGGETYYFRRVVPVELREVLGKRELKVSLKTTDKRLAKQKAAGEAIKADALLESARLQLAPVTETRSASFTPQELTLFRREYIARFLKDDEEVRADGGPDVPVDEDGIPAFDPNADLLEVALEDRQHPYFQSQAEWFASAKGLQVGPKSAAHAQLVNLIREATIDAVRLAMKRDRGEYVETPAVAPEASLPLSKVIERWRLDKQPKEKSLKDADKVLREFVALNGDLPIGAITKSNIVALKDSYLAAQSANNRGGAAATGNKKLGLLSAVLELAARDGFIAANPAKGVKLAHGKTAVKRRHFRVDELQTLFGHAVFTKGERTRASAGEATFWLPLMGLYSGGRLHELAQLRLSDFREHPTHGHYFEIHARGEGNSVKSAESTREVPVHPELIRLGLIEYVTTLRSKGEAYLFPLLPRDPETGGVLTDPISKSLNRLIGSVGLTDKSLVFHGLRHTFVTYARDCGISGGICRAIVGHEAGDVHEGYGDNSLKAKVAAMDAYRIEGLDLARVLRLPTS